MSISYTAQSVAYSAGTPGYGNVLKIIIKIRGLDSFNNRESRHY